MFWLNYHSKNNGIINNQGEWIVNDSNAYLTDLYLDGIGIFINKSINYLFNNKGKIYPFPENITVGSRVEDYEWIVYQKIDSTKQTYHYGIYSVIEKRWILELTPKQIYKITPDLYYYYYSERIYTKDKPYYDIHYGIINKQGQIITKHTYKTLSKTSTNELVIVTEHASNKQFYVKIRTGEELKE